MFMPVDPSEALYTTDWWSVTHNFNSPGGSVGARGTSKVNAEKPSHNVGHRKHIRRLRPRKTYLEDLRAEFNESCARTFWSQIRSKAQHAHSMNLRPDQPGEHDRVSGPDVSGLLPLSNGLRENTERAHAGWTSRCRLMRAPAEHHLKMCWMFGSKPNVCKSHRF